MHVRNICAVVLLFFLSTVSPASSTAQIPESTSISYAPRHLDLIPSSIEVYADQSAVTNLFSRGLSKLEEEHEREIPTRPSLTLPMSSARTDGTDGTDGRKYLPILLSVLVPGAGELYLGHVKRGVALMAVEAGAWTGYFYYRGKGLDTRDEYENFADAHWDVQKWADHHPNVYDGQGTLDGFTPAEMDSIGRLYSGTGAWPGYIPYISKEEDKQHYYENIGKYDWYISGWEDFDPSLDPFPRNTALRDQYRALRKQSNDQLDDANLFVYLSLAARVYSVVETILLTREPNDENKVGAAENRFSFKVSPKGYGGGEVALEYRFK